MKTISQDSLKQGDLYYDNPRKLLCRVEDLMLDGKGSVMGYHLIPKTRNTVYSKGYFMFFGEENISVALAIFSVDNTGKPTESDPQ